MTARLIYRGPIELGDGGPTTVAEVWASETAAVVFRGGDQLGWLTAMTLALTDDRRLIVSGTDEESNPAQWTGIGAEQTLGRWSAATVTWADDEVWTQAEVTWSQYAVRVTAPGQTARDLIGARTEVVGRQRWIIDGDDRIAASSPRKGCGCGGR